MRSPPRGAGPRGGPPRRPGALGGRCAGAAPRPGARGGAISTDMQTPKDIDLVSVYVTSDDAVKFDYLARVLPDGTVSLPSTLAIVEAANPSARIRVRVVAFKTQTSGAASARVVRDVLTTIPHQRVVLLRMPLSFLDDGSAQGTLPSSLVPGPLSGHADGDTSYDPATVVPTDPGYLTTPCPFSQGLTSTGGRCVSAAVDSSTLPAYAGADVFGDGGLQPDGTPATCQDVAACLASATPVPGVDLNACTFTLPAVPQHMNLALGTPGTGECTPGGPCFVPIDQDAATGWTLSGSTVEMVPGVCAKLNLPGYQLYETTAPGCAFTPSADPICQPAAALPDAGPPDATLPSDGGTVSEASAMCAADASCSCAAGGSGVNRCGPNQESCCLALPVTGGTFFRSYSYLNDAALGTSNPATVSSFRLDKYEATVGRFRQFVQTWNGGYRPSPGSGKHPVNGGMGLVDVGLEAGAAFETGWSAADDANVAPTDANLQSCQCASWTTAAGAQETLPMSCVNWYEAYAFCIWDGGFLPSEAELEYAEAGGAQQRLYPWGSADPGTASQYAIYGHDYTMGTCTVGFDMAPVGTTTLGAGVWGQFDLGGNVTEWTIDWASQSLSASCTDCAVLTPDPAIGMQRTFRGGNYEDLLSTQTMEPATRNWTAPATRLTGSGFRCARP